MNLIEKIKKVEELTGKLITTIGSQISTIRGFREYLGNYRSVFNPQEKDLGNRYISDLLNILLSYVTLIKDVNEKP